jgi:hypothetical protein
MRRTALITMVALLLSVALPAGAATVTDNGDNTVTVVNDTQAPHTYAVQAYDGAVQVDLAPGESLIFDNTGFDTASSQAWAVWEDADLVASGEFVATGTQPEQDPVLDVDQVPASAEPVTTITSPQEIPEPTPLPYGVAPC